MDRIIGKHHRCGKRRTGVVSGAAIAVVVGLFGASESRAQDLGVASTFQDDGPLDRSRDDWKSRVEESKRRAKEAAMDRRLHPEKYPPPPPEDPDLVAIERALRDDSLQRGDIVATKKGLLMYRGRSDQPRSDGDFVAMPSR